MLPPAEVNERLASTLARSTSDILRIYLGEEGNEIAESLKTLNLEMPALVGGPDSLRPANNQVSWGITRRQREYKVIILAEENDASRALQQLDAKYGSVFVTRVTGQAQSFDPSLASKHKPYTPLRAVPGASIGHVQGYPGTLGCFVRSTELDSWIGVLSASHVLGRNNQSNPGESIISPGHPDGFKTKGAEIGTLADYVFLTHFQNKSDNYLCCEDVAVVKIGEAVDLPERTVIWAPKNPDTLMPIKAVIGGQAVADRLEEPVYKVGRTTGMTRGILDIVGLQRQRVAIGDRHYIYTNVLAVRCEEDRPFSKAGDSGALVYTEDGYAIGLVIAGTPQYTFVSPLDACLQNMKVTLLQ
jgi:hypothetical protein